MINQLILLKQTHFFMHVFQNIAYNFFSITRRQLNFLLNGQSGELFRVGKIIIILSLSVGKSKYKNIDHRGKETQAYENDHIFPL